MHWNCSHGDCARVAAYCCGACGAPYCCQACQHADRAAHVAEDGCGSADGARLLGVEMRTGANGRAEIARDDLPPPPAPKRRSRMRMLTRAAVGAVRRAGKCFIAGPGGRKRAVECAGRAIAKTSAKEVARARANRAARSAAQTQAFE